MTPHEDIDTDIEREREREGMKEKERERDKEEKSDNKISIERFKALQKSEELDETADRISVITKIFYNWM